MTYGLLATITGFAVSAWLTQRFTLPESRFFILDHPNERSLHTRPTPRTGGLAIMVGAATAMVIGVWGEVASASGLAGLFVSAALVAGISFADDRTGVSVKARFAVHSIAAAILVVSGFDLPGVVLGAWGVPLPEAIAVLISIVFIIWMVNLYNFMDGMDGFAGGMAVIGFGAFAFLGMDRGHELFVVLNLVIAAASAGFLLFNFPPARIFMGDTGSSTLGLLAAAMMLWAQRDGLFALDIGILVFSPFIVDATVTVVRRLYRGEKIWQAHRTHYYQRLVQLGWGHRKTVLWEYALMLGCALTAVWVTAQSLTVQLAGLGVWAAVYAVLALLVSRLERRAAGVLP